MSGNIEAYSRTDQLKLWLEFSRKALHQVKSLQNALAASSEHSEAETLKCKRELLRRMGEAVDFAISYRPTSLDQVIMKYEIWISFQVVAESKSSEALLFKLSTQLNNEFKSFSNAKFGLINSEVQS